MDLFETLRNSILQYKDNRAFCIDGVYYSYGELAEKISAIRLFLSRYVDMPGKGVGLVVNDDLETYATIISIWLEGLYYVPLNPQIPFERNEEIIRQTDLKIIIDSSDTISFPDYINIESRKLSAIVINLQVKIVSDEAVAYTLFTSGSTGIPKGVPITRNNLHSFVNSYLLLGLDTNEKDRWLQMFDLTFDLSIFSFLLPLLQGACVYTIPKNKVKNQHIFKLLEEHNLTVALMIPSVLHFLRPYFEEICNRTLKYSLFCGEALSVDLIEKWSACVPLADIFNLYGPTEATIFCICYPFKQKAVNKSENGVLTIGRPMQDIRAMIVDEESRPVKCGVKGELCLSGVQITPGYLNSAQLNASSFFEFQLTHKVERFYKTGDVCSMDSEGDILFTGRMDSQIKINGFRVELSEVEYHAGIYLTGLNLVALAFSNEWTTTEIGLVIESPAFDTRTLIDYLKKKLPYYMIPAVIRFENSLPLSENGKKSRKELLKSFQRK